MFAITEIFYSLQGEGCRAGLPHVFVRFAGCNLDCDLKPGPRSPGGFRCDTDFEPRQFLPMDKLLEQIKEVDVAKCGRILFTGGEPALQVTPRLIAALRELEYELAIETNGTVKLPVGLDWVCCSPKTQNPVVTWADEAKYLIKAGQPLPENPIQAENLLVSPVWEPNETCKRETVEWCLKLVRENPAWRLSVQYHKIWAIR